jgi:hypothetical protein
VVAATVVVVTQVRGLRDLLLEKSRRSTSTLLYTDEPRQEVYETPEDKLRKEIIKLGEVVRLLHNSRTTSDAN